MSARKTILIIDYFGHSDATRTTLFNEFSKTVDFLTVLNLNIHKSIDTKKIQNIIDNILCKADILFVLSMNNFGGRYNVGAYLKQKGIPLVVWYIDSPFMSPLDEQNLMAEKIYHACDEFAEHPALKANSEFLPFSSVSPYSSPITEPSKGILFLGTCWYITRVMQKVAVGLKRLNDGISLDVQDITKIVDTKEFLENQWQYIDGTVVNNNDVLNAYAAIKRCQHLLNLADLDLKIFGGYDWIINTASTAPSLALNFTPKIVTTHNEMNQLMRDFKVSLNIFHIQNKNGGPNFRILDSIVHGVPILSDYKQRCAEIYPHGEAALYYKSFNEAREYAQILLNDRKFSNYLIRNAKNILRAAHLHFHRVDSIWRGLNMVPIFSNGGKVFIIEPSFKLSSFVNTRQFESDVYIEGKNLHKTNIYLYEKFWAQYSVSTERTLEILKERINVLEQKGRINIAQQIIFLIKTCVKRIGLIRQFISLIRRCIRRLRMIAV